MISKSIRYILLCGLAFPCAVTADNALAQPTYGSPTLQALKLFGPATVTGSGGFWSDQTPVGIVNRMQDRLLVGGATANNGTKNPTTGRTWLGLSAAGYDTYMDSYSQLETLSTLGGPAIVGASRTSDAIAANSAAIGVIGFALNDNTSLAENAWGFYGSVIQNSGVTGAGGSTLGAELEVANLGPQVTSIPYSQAPANVTSTLWLGAGGEKGTDGVAQTPISAAISIVRSNPATAGTTFDRGVVFGASALTGGGANAGPGHAITMAKGHQIEWSFDGTGTLGGFIRSDATTSLTNALIFNNTGAIIANAAGAALVTFDTSGDVNATGHSIAGPGKAFILNNGSGPSWTYGTGAPSATAPNGSMYSRTDGATGTRLYISSGGGTWLAVPGV